MGRWEKGPPQNALIFIFGVLTVLTLVALKPALDAYYDGMFDRAVEHQLTTYDDLGAIGAAQANLSAEQGDIERAMEQLGTRGRMAFPAITPRADAEQNLDALRGWGQLQQEVPERPAPEPELLIIPGDEISPDVLENIENIVNPEGIQRVVNDAPPQEQVP